jgi:hypothetical protein
LGEIRSNSGTGGSSIEARAAGARLERLVQRPHQLPAVEAAAGGGCRCAQCHVGRQERVRLAARLDLRRHDLALGERGGHDGSLPAGGGRVGDDELVLGQLGARLEQPVAAHALGDRRGRLVDLEQLDQRGVAGRGLGEDRRDAVEALEQLGTRGGGHGLVGLHARALLAHEEGDHLELDAVGRAELARWAFASTSRTLRARIGISGASSSRRADEPRWDEPRRRTRWQWMPWSACSS